VIPITLGLTTKKTFLYVSFLSNKQVLRKKKIGCELNRNGLRSLGPSTVLNHQTSITEELDLPYKDVD